MDVSRYAAWFLEHEARALHTRIERVKFFALFETAVPAAIPSRAAYIAVERFLKEGRDELRRSIHGCIAWLRSPEGRAAPPEEAQARLCLLRLQFNAVLTQYDTFADAMTQRSEYDTGVWLAGLDEAAACALQLDGDYYEAPPVICYLDRGHGAAIRRARTRLPGGGDNPVALIRIPRERMVGSGIASSLVHEVGHQGSALLNLVESLRPVLYAMQRKGGVEREAWVLWERWISEILADYWAVAKLGITAALGLAGVVSMPSAIVFRISTTDPHPSPWIRLILCTALGESLYPDPQWRILRRIWLALYPPRDLPDRKRRLFELLLATMPGFVGLLASHRPRSLKGRSLAEVMRIEERVPKKLAEHYQGWRRSWRRMETAPPTLALAAIGQARWNGLLGPEAEGRLVASLLQQWALARAMGENGGGADKKKGLRRNS
ncbi:MAG: hypothetical protein IT158_21385 [Bryobacterales bacterium]|nr:hypothetical protein [Bryobacterales bacterium]